jgi:hypothetical protein
MDVEEWKRPPAALMVQTVMDAVRLGSMIGFHDTAGEETRKAVVVTRLRADGYSFQTVTALAATRKR